MINLTLIVLRGVGRASAELGFISEERADSLHLVRGLPVPHNRPAPGQVLAPHVVARVFTVCWQDRSIAGLRDLALLHGIYWAGLSTAELASLRVDDYTPSPPVLHVHSARSARQRRVELVDESVVFERWRAVRGFQLGAFFLRLRRGSLQTGMPMTAGGITQTVRHRAVSAGLAPLGPQDPCRTAIHDLFESGASLTDVHRRFGFVSHVTLAGRYDHRDLHDPRWQAQTWQNPCDAWSLNLSGRRVAHIATASHRATYPLDL